MKVLSLCRESPLLIIHDGLFRSRSRIVAIQKSRSAYSTLILDATMTEIPGLTVEHGGVPDEPMVMLRQPQYVA
jgi:hypothetical protein